MAMETISPEKNFSQFLIEEAENKFLPHFYEWEKRSGVIRELPPHQISTTEKMRSLTGWHLLLNLQM